MSRWLKGAVASRVYFCYIAVLSLANWSQLQRHARHKRFQVVLRTLLQLRVFALHRRWFVLLLDSLIPAFRRLRGRRNGLRTVLVTLVATLRALRNAEAEAARETAEAKRSMSVRDRVLRIFSFVHVIL